MWLGGCCWDPCVVEAGFCGADVLCVVNSVVATVSLPFLLGPPAGTRCSLRSGPSRGGVDEVWFQRSLQKKGVKNVLCTLGLCLSWKLLKAIAHTLAASNLVGSPVGGHVMFLRGESKNWMISARRRVPVKVLDRLYVTVAIPVSRAGRSQEIVLPFERVPHSSLLAPFRVEPCRRILWTGPVLQVHHAPSMSYPSSLFGSVLQVPTRAEHGATMTTKNDKSIVLQVPNSSLKENSSLCCLSV